MAANIVDLCNGVVTALNGGSFSESFTAVFQYAPQYTLPDTDDLHVVVTDSGGTLDLHARSLQQHIDSVRIVLLYRVEKDGETGYDDDKIAAMLLLLQEIAIFMAKLEPAGYKRYGAIERGTGEKDKSHFYPGNLDQGNVFASSLTVPFTISERV